MRYAHPLTVPVKRVFYLVSKIAELFLWFGVTVFAGGTESYVKQ